MTVSLSIRPIRDADIPSVIALWNAAGVARPWNDPTTDIGFARRNPHSTVLVGERDGRIVASAMVGEDGHRGWVYYVAIDPGLQGQGLGRAIMDAAEAWLVARGNRDRAVMWYSKGYYYEAKRMGLLEETGLRT